MTHLKAKMNFKISTKKMKLGFSLIEAMIAMAIMAIVSLAMSSMLSYLFKSQNLASSKQDLAQAALLVQGALSNANICASSLLDAANAPIVYNGAVTNVASIKNGPTTFLAVNTNYSPLLTITRMQILPSGVPATTITVPAGSTNPLPGTYSQWIISLQIVGAAVNNTAAIAPKKINLTVYTDATQHIKYCAPVMTTSESCSALSMTFNPSTQNCQLGVCSATTVTAGYDCPYTVASNPSCTAPVYFWSFRGTGTTATPICVCSQVCTSPPPAPPIYYSY